MAGIEPRCHTHHPLCRDRAQPPLRQLPLAAGLFGADPRNRQPERAPKTLGKREHHLLLPLEPEWHTSQESDRRGAVVGCRGGTDLRRPLQPPAGARSAGGRGWSTRSACRRHLLHPQRQQSGTGACRSRRSYHRCGRLSLPCAETALAVAHSGGRAGGGTDVLAAIRAVVL